MTEVLFRYLPGADTEIPLPAYATAGAAGADIRANLAAEDRDTGLKLAPMARVLVPTGLACAIPHGFEMQIRARSGLALKHGLILPNAPATIDSDYRGPLGVILQNLGDAPFTVEHGMRIAQIVIAPVVQAQFRQGDNLPETTRGAGGYGHTGTH
ncbi:dUTP diphosphatase [Roseibaca sp. V10]|uniref:Deoxyuridine 5'-triphosphate nucleotidohydrolase n=1 Tax=Roseinatronobacter domitianus TaxID=2940293 RepID=A0ABT0M0G4_9RHOB|nr:dUTP diphosphatase [Roseibaca domitiana]MCL1628356.1 dUTP diphosphatase [Roseibaca domitiana]